MQWCADESYRNDLLARRYLAHVNPINRLVDRIRRDNPGTFVPYVAPTFGGVHARMISLFQDPGPKTNPSNTNGSGMLCIENDDESAARHKMFLSRYGIDVFDVVSWNSFPWYGPKNDGDRTADEKHAALVALGELILYLDEPRVIMLHGSVAKNLWGEFQHTYPNLARKVEPIPSWHTSPRVVQPSKNRSLARVNELAMEIEESFALAAKMLRSGRARRTAVNQAVLRESANTVMSRLQLTPATINCPLCFEARLEEIGAARVDPLHPPQETYLFRCDRGHMFRTGLLPDSPRVSLEHEARDEDEHFSVANVRPYSSDNPLSEEGTTADSIWRMEDEQDQYDEWASEEAKSEMDDVEREKFAYMDMLSTDDEIDFDDDNEWSDDF